MVAAVFKFILRITPGSVAKRLNYSVLAVIALFRLALGMAFRFYTLLANELKLKVKTFWGLIPRFAEITGEKPSRVKSEYSFIKV